MKIRLPFALLLLLAACGSEPTPEPEPYNEPVAEDVTNVPEPLPPEPIAEPVNIPEPVAETPPPPEPVAPDEQVLEDAEATGMTARVNREDEATENQPAEEGEQE